MTPTLGLEVVGLEKTFGDSRVVRGLDLALAAGEIVALLGPSGCGKTTALRLVAGLERPDGGIVRIAGRTVRGEGVDLPPEARRVGMVFQSYAIWPHRSVRENVAYPLRLEGAKNAEAASDEALEVVRLAGLGDRRPDTLSGGQQQRVALARALVSRPSLLLFDEPLSNLDANLREEMRHEVRELVSRTGITSLYVTHDQGEAFAVSDRVAVVLGGRVAQIDRPEVLYRAPANLEVAGFVGRMSLLSGIAREAEDRVSIAGATSATATFAAPAEDPGRWVAAVRPESIRLEAAPDGALPGRVLRSTFLGERRELIVSTAAGDLRVDVAPHHASAVGDIVHLKMSEVRVFSRAEDIPL